MSSLPQHDSGLKRQCSLNRDQNIDNAADVSASMKLRKDGPQANWVPSRRFWDTLPKIYLTRRALAEIDRRCRQQDLELSSKRQAEPQQPCADVYLQQSCRSKESSFPPSAHTSVGLKRFARGGGPDLTSIRGFPDPTMGNQISLLSKQTLTTTKTRSSKRSGPYDPNYQLKLGQAGVFTTEEVDENDEIILPANYDQILSRLKKRRPSLSPSSFTEKDFRNFRRQTQNEVLEAGTMSKSIPVIEGTNRHFSRMGGKFNNLVPFDPDLADAVPDSYDGAQPLSIDRGVLSKLGSFITPTTDTSRPAVPNFFLEGKGRQARAHIAPIQAAHTGAIGARGMAKLQSYPSQDFRYDNNAYSFTSTYYAGFLTIYCSHATAPKTSKKEPQYHMTQIASFAMIGDAETFRKGATYYRNARDLAKEQRDAFIQQANQKAQQSSSSKHIRKKRRIT